MHGDGLAIRKSRNPPHVAYCLHPYAAQKAMKIAADADIYTNHNFQTEIISEASGS